MSKRTSVHALFGWCVFIGAPAPDAVHPISVSPSITTFARRKYYQSTHAHTRRQYQRVSARIHAPTDDLCWSRVHVRMQRSGEVQQLHPETDYASCGGYVPVRCAIMPPRGASYARTTPISTHLADRITPGRYADSNRQQLG